MSLTQIHAAVANACLIFSLIIAGYGFLRYLLSGRPAAPSAGGGRPGAGAAIDGSFWGALIVGELLFVAQMVLGFVLLGGGLRPARTGVHILYGVLLVLVLPGAYAATRGRDGRREALMYALIGLFLAGVSLRAMATAATGLGG